MASSVVAVKTMTAQRMKPTQWIVTLPLGWVKAVSLRKGEPLQVEILNDGSLRIVPLRNNQDAPGARQSTESPVAADAPADQAEEASQH